MNKNKLCSFRINALLTKILVITSLLLNSTILYLADIVKYPNSDYFRITEFKESFTGGKNGFLIEGSEYLKESTDIKIEILDMIFHPTETNLISLGLINGKLRM